MTPNLSGLTLLLGNQVVGGTTVTGEVTLSGPATQQGGQPVTFNLDPQTTGSRIRTVYVPDGATSTTFSVTFKAVTHNTTSTIWANSGNNGGVTLHYPVTVTPGATPPPPAVTLSSITVSAATVASGGSLTATVNLSGAAPAGGAAVTLSESPSIMSVPISVTVGAGATSFSFAITAPEESSNTTYTITGTYGSSSAHVSFVVQASVTPPPPTPPTVSITAPAAGATVSGTITASANASDAQGIASVQWEIDGSTSLGTDTAAPYTETIDTTKIANGSHTLTAIAKDVAGLTTTSSGVAITVNNTVTPPPPPPSGSLASTLGTPSFADTFNYTSSSEAAFTANWVPQIYTASNYAGAGSNVSMVASHITFPVDPSLGVPCLCLTLTQGSSSASTGGEILSAASLFASTGLGGYGTYEFLVRFGSTSATPTGAGSAVSGGVSSTFLLSQSNGGSTGYVEIDAPEVEGQHATWAEYDVWFNSDSGNNHEPSGGNFVSQGAGNDSYIVVPNLAAGFNYLGFVWSAGSLVFYLNGVEQGSLTGSGVPTAQTAAGNIPGIDINHYGCNSSDWGGSATVGTTRYLYVQSAKFWKA